MPGRLGSASGLRRAHSCAHEYPRSVPGRRSPASSHQRHLCGMVFTYEESIACSTRIPAALAHRGAVVRHIMLYRAERIFIRGSLKFGYPPGAHCGSARRCQRVGQIREGQCRGSRGSDNSATGTGNLSLNRGQEVRPQRSPAGDIRRCRPHRRPGPQHQR